MSTATCPLCGATYLAAASVCADCRVALVPDPPEAGATAPEAAATSPGGSGEPAEPAWPDGDEEVGYELDDWGPDDREALTAALRAERVPHEWREDEVVVPERWADLTEALIDAIDHPDALDVEDDGDDGGADLLGALYVASDILSGDPTASGAVIDVLELAPTMEGRAAPYGVDGRLWRAVGERVAELAALLDADGEEDDVRTVAVGLRGLLRDLV